MMRLIGTITVSLGFISLAVARTALKPWEISRLTTFSPSGRPGSSPWSVINITISDPNDATVSPTTCVGQWTFEEPPWGQTHACAEVPGGQWSFVMLQPGTPDPTPITNFKLRFELKKETAWYLGEEKFYIGDNLSGLCSASGICSFGLKEDMNPFPVKQVRVQ